jgi:hypothetical protein
VAANPNAWLSNFELDAAQYESTYPEFKYSVPLHHGAYGTGPGVDPHRDLTYNAAGSSRTWIVHTEGTHWVGIVLDCRTRLKPVCYYYDSLAPARHFTTVL